MAIIAFNRGFGKALKSYSDAYHKCFKRPKVVSGEVVHGVFSKSDIQLLKALQIQPPKNQ